MGAALDENTVEKSVALRFWLHGAALLLKRADNRSGA
jgi:hypothetical protein